MIDIVAVVLSPKVTPSGLTVSGITRVMLNEDSCGSYFVSSMIFTMNTNSFPKEGSNITFDEINLKSSAINVHQIFS